MPRGEERVPKRAVRTSRDGRTSREAKGVEEDREATRHAALCRLLAQGFDRVERGLGGAVSIEGVALVAMVAAAFHATPGARPGHVVRMAWEMAEAWVAERAMRAGKVAS